ncbi:HAD-IA family hydrolase [Streptomyces sp. N2-109]|uniref:HAD-IA family hydrolase n=1 Tax=Streptomyces gossypii TaxID=2883101 RepID=A0ABT2JU23_9ACTN|nr:HAD-IA family hydrolase [Streptomyces gossypii]MCT2591388.1 HAD-IA family hydrolase [Streptomyces gossypii]
MTVTAVLFDFSGTLLRVEPVTRWLGSVLRQEGIALPEEEFARCAALLEEAGALPGGTTPRSLPPELAHLWAERDRSAQLHREAYTALARRVPLPGAGLHEALYERHKAPDAWQPYPDTEQVLAELVRRGVPVAVVSNIGWDLRPVFRAHGLDRYVRDYLLSFEHGIQKPDPRLFQEACRRLGRAPGEVLMVGDDARADGGAADIGCAVHLVEHLPVERRPHGLGPVLERLDEPA